MMREQEIDEAKHELYGGYRVELMGLASAIERGFAALERNRERHPGLYDSVLPTDRDVVLDAIETWLGYDADTIASAVRKYLAESSS